MGLEVAVVLAAVAVVTDFAVAVAAAAVAGSDPRRCGGTLPVRGNPKHG